MTKISPTIKKLVLVFLALVVVIVADYMLFSSIKSRTSEVNSIVSQNSVLESEESQTSSFNVLYQDSTAERADLDSYILQQSAQVAFVEKLGDLAKSAGVTLTIAGLGTSADPASSIDVQFFNATLQVQGTWAQTTYFLALIEALPYSLKVNTLELQKNTSASASGSKASVWNGSFTLSILTYEQK